MQSKEATLKNIVSQGILPLFYHDNPEICLGVVKTLYDAGIRTVEFTNRGPKALENFTFLKRSVDTQFPGLELGAGTVKTTEEAAAFIGAGADYIVSPIVQNLVGKMAHEAGLLWIPGCMTPSEIFTAQQAGALLIKIFPANVLGPAFISSIRELFPGQQFIPTGGVEIEKENLRSWFSSGVSAVGMGSKLISKEILQSGKLEDLYKLTVKALELVKENR